MSPAGVRLVGPWSWDRVTVRHVASGRVLDPEVERLVDRTFAEQQGEAERLGMRLGDGPAYRLEDAARTVSGLVLSLAEVPYRVHSAMKVLHDDPRVRDEHRDRVLVVDGLVRDRDGRVVLLRTPKVTGPELQLVGSTATPGRHVVERARDLASFLAACVGRALDVPPAEVEVGPLLGLVDHVVGCVNVVVDVRLAVPAAQVRPRPPSQAVVVEAEAVVGALAAGPAYLPAVADLLRRLDR